MSEPQTAEVVVPDDRVQSESERIEERLAMTTAVADRLGVPVQNSY